MGSYKKQVRGDNNQANEQFAHNHITIFNDGSGKIIVCFLIVVASLMIVFLWITFHLFLVVIILGTTIVASVVGVSSAWRHVSHTRKEHLVNEAEIEWSRVTYAINEFLVAHRDRAQGPIQVTNASQVQEVHHYDQHPSLPTGQADNFEMPSLYDLTEDGSK